MSPLLCRLLLVPAILLCAVGARAEPLRLAVSIAPLEWIASRLAPEAEVMVLVAPGESPATFEPSPGQMAALSKSALFFAAGVPFERAWLPRIRGAHPELQVVRAYGDLKRAPMADHGEKQHHGDDHAEDGHGHEPGAPDPHVWLSPPLVRVMAATMRDALIEAEPSRAAEFRANYLELAREANRVDSEVLKIFAAHPGARKVVVFHPAFAYFCRTYGLEQIVVEAQGKEPGPRELAAIIERAEASGARTVFVQPQFPGRAAEHVARELGGRIVYADPLAADWPANMRNLAQAFAAGAAGVVK